MFYLVLQANTQSCGSVTLKVFDRVIIQISIDQSNVQHLKLKIQLVTPEVNTVHSLYLVITPHYTAMVLMSAVGRVLDLGSRGCEFETH